jgi:hypothetical protein
MKKRIAPISSALASVVGAALLAGGANAAVLLSDSFSYADGSLTAVSSGKWANHSGTAGQVDVASGKVNLTEAESEDVNAQLSGGPFTTGLLYAGLDFNFSALPSGTGTYFAHFKDATTSGFRARVFATTTGAAAGLYRIGITNAASTSPVVIPVDLSLGTTHRLIESYDAAAATSTLYLDSTTETGGTAAADSTTTLPITSYALRQSLSSGVGMGTLTVDNLAVATTFAEVVPEPGSIALVGLAASFWSSRRRRRA